MLSHDDFDAALCAITGASGPEDQLEQASLEREIQARLALKTELVPERFDAPEGYVLLTRRPIGVRINVQPVKNNEGLSSIIRQEATR